MGPRARLDFSEKRKIISCYRKSNSVSSSPYPVLYGLHYCGSNAFLKLLKLDKILRC